MINSAFQSIAGKVRQPFSNALGCHLLGASLSVCFLLATYMVWSQKNIVVNEVTYGQRVIDLHEARTLIAQADSWRKQYTQVFQESQQIDRDVDAIEQWLPRQLDWDGTVQQVQTIAASSNVKIVLVGDSTEYVGSRVGVAVASCQVEGSYDAICRFVVALSDARQPITCSELQLQRMQPQQSWGGDRQTPCAATLTLRVPFAAEGSIASRLLSTDRPNAS